MLTGSIGKDSVSQKMKFETCTQLNFSLRGKFYYNMHRRYWLTFIYYIIKATPKSHNWSFHTYLFTHFHSYFFVLIVFRMTHVLCSVDYLRRPSTIFASETNS